ncbi:hypothetical protein TeGR_g15271, partial [Tetraparma gracilis]
DTAAEDYAVGEDLEGRDGRVETVNLDDDDDIDNGDSDSDENLQQISLLSPSPFNRSRSVDTVFKGTMLRRTFALGIICVFGPLMCVCTYNAVHNLISNNS